MIFALIAMWKDSIAPGYSTEHWKVFDHTNNMLNHFDWFYNEVWYHGIILFPSVFASQIHMYVAQNLITFAHFWSYLFLHIHPDVMNSYCMLSGPLKIWIACYKNIMLWCRLESFLFFLNKSSAMFTQAVDLPCFWVIFMTVWSYLGLDSPLMNCCMWHKNSKHALKHLSAV